MDQQTLGIFGPQGLLANLEAEEKTKGASDSNSNNSPNTKDKNREDDESLSKQYLDKNPIDGVNGGLIEIKTSHGNGNNDLNSKNSDALKSSTDYFVPLNSLPAAEAVFSIEKIREKIFSYSSAQDLLNFRLVSREWRSNATNKTLLNSPNNSIYITEYLTEFEVYLKHSHRKVRPLPELTQLMNLTGSHTFPCSNFAIRGKNLMNEDPSLEDFLTKHGFRLKQLEIDLIYNLNMESDEINDGDFNGSPMHTLVTTFMTKLLVDQVPNLHELAINFDTDFDLSEREEWKPTAKSKEILKANLNVRLVKFQNQVPQVLLSCIYSLCPKLTKLKWGFAT